MSDLVPESGTLFVCAVPIGNLDDASPRLGQILARMHAIACEDTRSTRKLLTLLGIETDARLLAHHEHNERGGAAGIVSLLEQGHDVALVSDAGTPAVSDPGVPLVDAAHAAGIDVVGVPGPSAVATAVSIAGFAGNGYRFVGFLPGATGQLEVLVRQHATDVTVAFTSPRRLRADLGVIAEAQPGRRIAVCRELTKLHEQVVRGTAGEVIAHFDSDVRGEIVLVLDAVARTPTAVGVDDDSVALVETLVAEGVKTKRACAIVADITGVAKRDLFDAVNAARD